MEATSSLPTKGQNRAHAPELLGRLSRHLREDGAIIIIEPGEKEQCLALKQVRNRAARESDLNVYSPYQGLWEEKREYNCSCFGMTRSQWEVPRTLRFLAERGLRHASRPAVPFNYLVLRSHPLGSPAQARNPRPLYCR